MLKGITPGGKKFSWAVCLKSTFRPESPGLPQEESGKTAIGENWTLVYAYFFLFTLVSLIMTHTEENISREDSLRHASIFCSMRAWAHTHTCVGLVNCFFSLFSSVRMAVIDWWNGPLTLAVIFFALCLLLFTWSIAGVACRACHSSGTFFSLWHTHTHTHTHTHARTHARKHLFYHCTYMMFLFFRKCHQS